MPDSEHTHGKESESRDDRKSAASHSDSDIEEANEKQPKTQNRTEQTKGGPQITPTPTHVEVLMTWSQWMQIWLPIFLSGILLVLVAVQAIIYHRQWKVMQEQAAEMKKSTDAATKAAQAAEDSVKQAMASARLDQRAWVAHMDIVGAPEVGKEFEAVVTVKNTGKTFAKNLTFMIVHETFPKGQLPDFSIEDSEDALKKTESVILLAPDGKTGFPTVNKIHEPLTQGEVDAFKSGEVTLFVHGRMTYDDIFGCQHWTKFCYRLLPHNFRYRTCEQHNDTDDNQCQ